MLRHVHRRAHVHTTGRQAAFTSCVRTYAHDDKRQALTYIPTYMHTYTQHGGKQHSHHSHHAYAHTYTHKKQQSLTTCETYETYDS